jgi:hypothetical protein
MAWKEPMMDERRSSDKGGMPGKPATEAAETANMRSNKTTTTAAHSTKAANMRSSKTTAAATAAHSTKATATKPRLRRSCQQHGADHGRSRDSGELLIDHGNPPLSEQPPRRQSNECQMNRS